MYCINCGVKLADSQDKCPLCEIVVPYHLGIEKTNEHPPYPENRKPEPQPNSKAVNWLILIVFLIPLLVMLIIDWQMNKHFGWFGYAGGAIVLGYIIAALPLWFRNPNPVIFVPCGYAAATLFLLYINLATSGDWFLSFAFPVAGAACLITTIPVVLFRYAKRGKLYIAGGTVIATGAFAVLIEFLLSVTFGLKMMWWSLYPLVVFTLIGGFLIYLAINRAARETMARKFFI